MERDMKADDRLRTALERLTTIQKSVLELNKEALRIRRHIQDFDVNMDALNLLVTARSKDEKGGGTRILEHMISYALQAGMRVESQGEYGSSSPPPEARPGTVEHLPEDVHEHPSTASWKTASQIAAALVVTIVLFVVIH